MIGYKCTILKSDHSDIMKGDEGVIEDILDKGYGVKITKQFPNALKLNEKREETRIIFFYANQVRIHNERNND